MNTPIVARDIHVRNTNTDGLHYVSSHRVWDADRFLAARQADAAKANAEAPAGQPRKASVDQITEDQFRRESRA